MAGLMRWRYANSNGKLSYGRWHEIAAADSQTITTACGKIKTIQAAEPLGEMHKKPTEDQICADCARLVAIATGSWKGHEETSPAATVDPDQAALAATDLPCECPKCRTAETEALRSRIDQARKAETALNRTAYNLYLIDLYSGQPTKTPAEYRKEAAL